MVIIPSIADTSPLLWSLANSVMRYSTALATPSPNAYSDMPATTLVTVGQHQVASTIRHSPARYGPSAPRTKAGNG